MFSILCTFEKELSKCSKYIFYLNNKRNYSLGEETTLNKGGRWYTSLESVLKHRNTRRRLTNTIKSSKNRDKDKEVKILQEKKKSRERPTNIKGKNEDEDTSYNPTVPPQYLRDVHTYRDVHSIVYTLLPKGWKQPKYAFTVEWIN